jgi:hypothetical protein
MAWDDGLQAHVQSGDRACTYYFSVPDAWAALSDDELQLKIFTVARAIYDDLNAGFRSAEPGDLSYMMVKSTLATRLDDAAAASKPWLQARNPSVWEDTPCVVVAGDGSYTKVARNAF